MRSKSISPTTLRRFVAPIIAKKEVEKKQKIQKARKASREEKIEASLNQLNAEVKPIKEPKYDPEFDMAEARFNESKKTPAKSPFDYSPSSIQVSKHINISNFGLKISPGGSPKLIYQDKFTYFTLIETLLIYNLMYKKLPEESLRISFGIYKTIKTTNSLISHLYIFNKNKPLKKYKITYDILHSKYFVFDCLINSDIGSIHFDLEKQNNYLEEANGIIDGKRIKIDPVWDRKKNTKINYQSITIGDRKLDLTSTSKNHRAGHWSFSKGKPPISFQVFYESQQTKKDHIVTTKRIQLGQSKITLTLKFFDDSFTEPYLAQGNLQIKYN